MTSESLRSSLGMTTELAHTDQGTGTPIVCIHGTLDDMRTWTRQLAPFAESHQMITYSRRWHWPNAAREIAVPYRAVDHRDDLIAIIEHLQLGAAHLVGASYGAIVALMVAVARPELVRSVVLGEPPLFTLLGIDDVVAHGNDTMIPARECYDAGKPEAGVASFLEAITGAGSFANFPEGAKRAALDNAGEFGLEAHSSIEDYFGPLTISDLRDVKAPALLLGAERSPAIFGRVLHELANALPHNKRLLVSNASHGMHRHNPAFYNAAVLDFIGATEAAESK